MSALPLFAVEEEPVEAPAAAAFALGRSVIHVGDCRDVLRTLPAESVHMVVTSPPYYSLRDYQTGTWEGGAADCDHKTRRPASAANGSTLGGGKGSTGHQQEGYSQVCARCGARRVDRQIGLEASAEQYLETMVDVFREVRRVLRPDGVLWLNIGDSYAGSGKGAPGPNAQVSHGLRQGFEGDARRGSLAPKNLMMIPARLALALQADGWILRSDIAWCKAVPMPESVTDRPTNAWEHIFLFAKRGRYFYDADAVREPDARPGDVQTFGGSKGRAYTPPPDDPNFRNGSEQWGRTVETGVNGRNLWSYWPLGPEPLQAEHYAAFPTEIPRRCILAGTSAKGVCPRCGAPWRRVTDKRLIIQSGLRAEGRTKGLDDSNGWGGYPRGKNEVQTTGWQPSCDCDAGEPVPAVVLDPFAGAGTSLMVANRLGRDAVGIELSPRYADMAARRIRADLGMLSDVTVTGGE